MLGLETQTFVHTLHFSGMFQQIVTDITKYEN